ncbi:hypothetical protein THTE_1951 [Thermogutta terrifontis]|uniref:Uncharacterized protein n=1 Tax=Thermogutta terrifontis TaxID=1331910 RepID=A0A286RF22_9BACT|nr:hypothetical protein THTE_1951 [Thermogutta terrifontis]
MQSSGTGYALDPHVGWLRGPDQERLAEKRRVSCVGNGYWLLCVR